MGRKIELCPQRRLTLIPAEIAACNPGFVQRLRLDKGAARNLFAEGKNRDVLFAVQIYTDDESHAKFKEVPWFLPEPSSVQLEVKKTAGPEISGQTWDKGQQ